MSTSHLPVPPPGFDELTRSQKLDYIDRLIECVEADGAPGLRPELVREIRARRERDRLHPEEAIPADVVRDELRARYA